MTSLAETQALFWRLISAPEGAAGAPTPLAAGLEAVVVGDERLSAAERVDVYGRMYFFRIQDAIRENFSALAAAVDALGETAWRDLVVGYLGANPSRHFSLREIGVGLEAFLRDSPLQATLPYAADVAAFEWAFLGAFDAPDADAVGAEALASIPPEAWAEIRLELSPTLRIVALDFAVAGSWERVGQGEAFEPPAATPTRYRLWRREHKVFYRTIEETERDALAAAAAGGTFGDVCAAIADRIGDEAGPAEAFAILSRWINDGIVVRIGENTS
jgi:hypothetical protein